MTSRTVQIRRAVALFALVGGLCTALAGVSGARQYLHLPVRNPAYLVPESHLPIINPNRAHRSQGVRQPTEAGARTAPEAVPAKDGGAMGAEAQAATASQPTGDARAAPAAKDGATTAATDTTPAAKDGAATAATDITPAAKDGTATAAADTAPAAKDGTATAATDTAPAAKDGAATAATNTTPAAGDGTATAATDTTPAAGDGTATAATDTTPAAKDGATTAAADTTPAAGDGDGRGSSGGPAAQGSVAHLVRQLKSPGLTAAYADAMSRFPRINRYYDWMLGLLLPDPLQTARDQKPVRQTATEDMAPRSARGDGAAIGGRQSPSGREVAGLPVSEKVAVEKGKAAKAGGRGEADQAAKGSREKVAKVGGTGSPPPGRPQKRQTTRHTPPQIDGTAVVAPSARPSRVSGAREVASASPMTAGPALAERAAASAETHAGSEAAAEVQADRAAQPDPVEVSAAEPATKAEAKPARPVASPDSTPDSRKAPHRSQPKLRFAAIDKLLAIRLTAEDKKNLQEAIYATYLRKYDRSTYAIGKIRNKDARALAQWYYLRRVGVDGNYKELEAFRRAQPDWPSQRRMRKRVERMIASASEPPETILAFFKDSPPETGAGQAALAMAELALGNKARAARLIRKVWHGDHLDTTLEELILEKFGDVLGEKDHVKRMHYFLYKNRTGYYIDAALRMAELAGKSRYMPMLKARSAVIHMDNTKGTKREIWIGRYKDRYKKLSARDRRDWGVRFNRIQYLRRQKKFNAAWKILLSAPTDTATIISPVAWWKERHLNARYALNMGRARLAYKFVSRHGDIKGKYLEQAEFLAGWIALRFMAEPEKARKHFQALRAAVTSRRGIAKAEYWLGRTEEHQKRGAAATAHYRRAAQYTHTFYGQLAQHKLDPQRRVADFRPLPMPTREESERFVNRPSVRGLIMAYKAERRALLPLFFNHLAWTLESPGELVLLNALARKIASKQLTVRVGKIAVYRGFPLDHFAYPIDVLPDYKRLVTADIEVEPALLYALVRQESEFNFRAKSWVGARGLMQFMPRTAKAVARQFKQRGHKDELLFNPKYNLMLGNAHLSDLVQEYRGSYIMTLCAYNAGGPRVSQWVKAFGDPRLPSVDPIDWVERIPFKETRQYVKKILTSAQIYRARFEDPNTAMRLYDDLHRGSYPNVLEQAPISDAAEPLKKEG